MSDKVRINRWRGVRTDGDQEPHLVESGDRQDSLNLWARTGSLVRRPAVQTVRQMDSSPYVIPLALFSIDVETDDDAVDNTQDMGPFSNVSLPTDRTRNTGVGVQLDNSGDGLPVQLDDP